MSTKIFTMKGPIGNQGAVGPPGPRVVSADSGNLARLGSDSLLYVPVTSTPLASVSGSGLLRQLSGNTTDFADGSNNYQSLATASGPTIQLVRLRTLNTLGNPNFDVDQRQVRNTATISGGTNYWICDRWLRTGGGTYSVKCGTTPATVLIPGTSYQIGNYGLYAQVVTPQATLGATDLQTWITYVEGCNLRPLFGDVHSLSLMVGANVSPVNFSVAIRYATGGTYYSLVLPCTYTAAGAAVQVINLPNLPVWTASAPWKLTAGNYGYDITVTLACGSTYVAPTNGVWLNGNYLAAAGMDNFVAKPAGSIFTLYFVQHEPGPECGPYIDPVFEESLSACQRYYCKSTSYGNLCPTSNEWRGMGMWISNTTACRLSLQFPVEMMSAPSVTIYDNGVTANAIYVDQYGSRACGAGGLVTTTACGSCTLNANPGTAGTCEVLGQWVADTGW
jgi:hypothetical protein